MKAATLPFATSPPLRQRREMLQLIAPPSKTWYNAPIKDRPQGRERTGSMSKQKILALLRESEGYLSGEEMSRRLGVSRAAVWKAIDGLRREGYTIDSATNRGYRLSAAPDLLTEGEIQPFLHTERIARHLEVFQSIDSTNNYLKREAQNGLPDGSAVIADEQTGGRGRRGRSFSSPSGKGIYFSVLLRPDVAPAEAVDLTAYVAVAVCDGIQEATGLRPQIKWTNDIIMNDHKVCGILTEMSIEGESGALQYVIPGIGVNVNQRAEDWPEELQAIAGSVAQAAGHPVSRGRLAACLLNALDRTYLDWLAGRRQPYLERYRRDCITLGREVRLIRPDGETVAQAVGIDDRFGLVIRHPDGREETVTSGEVSVRGLYGYV